MLQLETAECGAACLGMVLAHHGRHIGLEQLRIDCGVSRDGATARQLVATARQHGLTTNAYRREPNELRTLSFPLIVHWHFFHFVVVEGWFEGGWYLNDPATGPRPCDDKEFDENFTGIVIEAQPGPSFEPSGRRPGVVRRLAEVSGDPLSAGRVAMVAAVLLTIPTVVIPQLLRSFGNSLAPPGAIGAGGTPSGGELGTGTIVGGLLLAAMLMTAVLGVQAAMSVRLATRIHTRLTAAMVDRLLRLPATFHAQRGASVTTQRALVAEQLSDSVSVVLSTALTRALSVVVGSLVLLLVDPLAGAVTLVLTCLTALVARHTLVRSRDLAASVLVETIDAGTVVIASLTQIESIKAGGSESGMVALGRARQNRLLVAQQRVGSRSVASRAAAGLLGAISTLVVAAIMTVRVANGSASPGTFLAVLALAALVLGPVAHIVAIIDDAQLLRSSLDQIDDILTAPFDDRLHNASGEHPTADRGELELIDVTFGYSRFSAPVISNLSLRVTPGSRVALVGPSGCGKSTISRLVTGQYEPWSGEVRIDGIARDRHSPAVLADRVAYIDQDVSIFSGTLRDNITLWDPTVSEHDIERAARDAQLGDVIARRPGGLGSSVGERGADLSGGERQRLGIARALVRNPSLLVMDEATSALDPTTEQQIDLAIRRRGVTCLIVAHRLSTIRDCDEIVVLRAGVAVERGTHESLMSEDGVYTALVGDL